MTFKPIFERYILIIPKLAITVKMSDVIGRGVQTPVMSQISFTQVAFYAEILSQTKSNSQKLYD